MRKTITVNLGEIEVPLERQTNPDQNAPDRAATSTLSVHLHTNGSTLTCTINALICLETGKAPTVCYGATLEFQVFDLHEHPGFRIKRICSPTFITVRIPQEAISQQVHGRAPIAHFRIWPDADDRTSPRLDVTLQSVQLELEPSLSEQS
jgi:hypothetical protein